MNICFLGTGAADFSPLLETDFKEKLDKNARRSSAVLVNETLLIDCGPHTLDSFRIQGLDCSKVTDLLVTHFHDDHHDRSNIELLAKECKQPLRMWYRADARPLPMENVEFHPVKHRESFQAGAYCVTALDANHTAFPLHYDIERDGEKLFYGCDGAWFLNDTFYAMMHREYACMILDGTVGDYSGDYRIGEHNSIPMIRLMTDSFRTQDVIAPSGVICISHLARTLHRPHEETAEYLETEGYTIACDGLNIKI